MQELELMLISKHAGTLQGPINMNEHEIANLNKNPSLDYEAVPKKYVDTQRDTRVAKSGDTMTGLLNINGGLNYPQTNEDDAAISVNFFLTRG